MLLTKTAREHSLRKKAALGAATILLSMTLAACGGASSYAQVTLDEASGIKVTAENAGNDQSATTTGAITVKEGDNIVISPFTEKGSFHLTIVSSDDKETIYDDDVDGKVLFSIDAEPGTYDVTTTGNGTTGWMTVFAQNEEEDAQIMDDLNKKLEEEGVDPSIVPSEKDE